MSSDNEVGYKRPPRHTRFKKGRSGNPKGRPKGAKDFKTELTEELYQPIRIREDGRPLTVSRQRAILKIMSAKALQGDMRAANLILNSVYRMFNVDEAEPDEEIVAEEDLKILENYAARTQNRNTQRKRERGRKRSAPRSKRRKNGDDR